MGSVLIITLILTCILLCKGDNPPPKYKCVLSGNTCNFSYVVLDWDHYEWEPASDDPNAVEIIRFRMSNIPIVTKNLCETFPNLKELYLEELGVHEVREDAFHACRGLKILIMDANFIGKIHKNTFLYTTQLRHLDLGSNRIRFLNDHEIFSKMQDLNVLIVGANNLTEFSPELLRYNQHISELHLFSNDFSDLKVEEILNFGVDPAVFVLYDNEISCTRMMEIILLFESKRIHTYDNGKMYGKIRYYPQEKILDEFRCNPDISWMASHYRKENTIIHHQLSLIDEKVTKQEIGQVCQKVEEKNDKRLNQLDGRLEKMEKEMQKIVFLLSQLNHVK